MSDAEPRARAGAALLVSKCSDGSGSGSRMEFPLNQALQAEWEAYYSSN